MFGPKKEHFTDAAVIWAYHQYYDNKAVRFFDHFMNLALLFGFFKTTGFIYDTLKLLFNKAFRGAL